MTSISFFDPDTENGWLANFSSHPIVVDGVLWPTVEHYFQASKFSSTDVVLAELIRSARTPNRAKQIAKENATKKRQDWENVRLEIMRKAIEAKFLQYPELRKLLLATGKARIVENSQDDSYWGIGDGTGENMMGQLLQALRETLKLDIDTPREGNNGSK